MSSYFLRRCWLICLLVFSGIIAVSQAIPSAPTNLVAAAISTPTSGTAAACVLNWTENTANMDYYLDYSINGGVTWNSEGLLPASSIYTSGTNVTYGLLKVTAGQTYQFRVYAYDGANYSAPSNVYSLTSSVFSVTASLVPSQTAVNLSWTTVVGVTGYVIYQYSAASGAYVIVGNTVAGTTQYQMMSNNVVAGNAYSYQVRPYLGGDYISSSDPVGLDLDVITSKTGISGTSGSAVSQTFAQTTVGAVTSINLTWNGSTQLPPGLVFNTSTGVLSGVLPPVGVYTLVYSVSVADRNFLTQNFYVRVRPAAGAPLIGTTIPAWTTSVGSTLDTPLAGTFTDPEAESAVRVSTTLGTMNFILFNTATPATVANFMNYVNSGSFANVAFHRSLSGFVIQAGGYKGSGTGSNFSSVLTSAPVVNEPGISNLTGTLSMAKISGNADSATSQFFISLGNNSANLDYQNAGFTVFGRVAGNGMAVANAIASQPTGNYNLYLDGSPTATSFTDFPMNSATAPATMNQSDLININSVITIPTISYSVTVNTHPSVATASVVGGQLHLVGLAGGNTSITVTATNLDNQTNTQTIEVNLNDTFTTWAAQNVFSGGQNGATQSPNGDGITNLEVYAFLGNPGISNQGILPSIGKSGVAPALQYLTLTFPVRKFTSGLIYTVEASNTLSGGWTTVWSSASGLSGPQVVSALDQADRTVMTIQDTVAISQSPLRFLRTVVTQQ
jgi:cyclophilin family peptidyl-prolyl cis-trans isomerase